MRRFEGFEHGVNLGGWLSQCNHTKERYEKFISEDDIKKIAGWGADHIRLPVDYNLVEDADGNYIHEGFSYIDRAIEWASKNSLNLLLDLHKTFGYSFDSGEKESGFFENEKYQERFYRLWEELSRRYGKIGNSVAFELLNEVTEKSYCEKWNEISGRCVDRIRKIAPDVRIAIGGYHNNSITALKDLAMPKDENIVYNFHCYEPLVFTHQGAHWAQGMDTKFRMSLETSYSDFARLTKANLKISDMPFDSFEQKKILGAEFFERLFSDAVKIAEERNVPLYCGEYGVINLASASDTLKWYQLISGAFNKYKISRAAWSYKEMDFGLADEHLSGCISEIIRCL